MVMTEQAIDRIERRLVETTGRGIENNMAICPAHADQNPSLSVSQAADRVLVYCHALCSIDAIAAALSCKIADFFNEPNVGNITNCETVTADYIYQDAEGRDAHKNQRRAGKKFVQYRTDGAGGWIAGLKECELFPYRLPELLAAPADATVYICEGEKDVEAVRRAGGVATCNTGGVGMGWRETYSQHFTGRKRVVIIADKDAAGERHARSVYGQLVRVVSSVRIMQTLSGKDAFDHLIAGHSLAEFSDVTEQILDIAAVSTSASPSLSAAGTSSTPPRLHPNSPAFYGAAGDIVRTILPETEADPAALLVDLLTSFGNSVGSGPHAYADGSRHSARLFAVIVGKSAKARKGTSRAVISKVMEKADPEWADGRVYSGLASGEGLIASLSDPKTDDDGKPVPGTGSRDRRMLVHEPEFGRVLNINGREGSTLSHIIRDAWDSGNLRVMTRKDPLTATQAHISIIGHITVDELQKALSSTDISNGFGNRFLFIYAERGPLLPTGGNLADKDFTRLGRDLLSPYIDTARKAGLIRRTEQAERLWAEMYREIADDDPYGVLGSIVARADAQVLRLSLIYALLDGARFIEVEHLLAAKALWDYARSSAEFIFGQISTDPLAEKLEEELRAVYPEGLDSTQQSRLFANHADRSRLESARRLLEKKGVAITESVPTAGRPRLVTRLIGNELTAVCLIPETFSN